MTSQHLTNHRSMHRRAASLLDQIEHIQKELTYAKMRAAADLKCWLLSSQVPGWKAQIVRLADAYETKCAEYASVMLALADIPEPEVLQLSSNRLN